MKILLDTHILLWWLSDDRALPKEARNLIESANNVIYLSAASTWEIQIKQKLGKISLPKNFASVLRQELFEELPVTIRHTARLAELGEYHSDPFDRILIAQAIEDGLTLLTHDKMLAEYSPVVMAL